MYFWAGKDFVDFDTFCFCLLNALIRFLSCGSYTLYEGMLGGVVKLSMIERR